MKKTLREKTLQRLQLLSTEEKLHIEKQMFEHFIQSNLWKNKQYIGVTIANALEWDTREIIEFLWQHHVGVLVPKVTTATKEMHFYELKDFNQLEIGYANILEPNISQCKIVEAEKIDAIIVPGVLYNEEGYRIGYGGGYYDRFLQNNNGITMSLVAEQQISDCVPIEAHDIPVQYYITETGVHHVYKRR